MKPAEKAFAWALVVPKAVQDAEEFFMVHSGYFRLRQVRAPCNPQDPEFHL